MLFVGLVVVVGVVSVVGFHPCFQQGFVMVAGQSRKTRVSCLSCVALIARVLCLMVGWNGCCPLERKRLEAAFALVPTLQPWPFLSPT